uniref:[acyl-carrier-protein] S-malonyltransferase n=1 Tax=Hirondellea gigas TaxID=1518452 RepID=A0A6A7FSZ4_9CRUS
MQEASEMVAGGMMTAFFGPLTKLGLCCSTAKEFCERKDIENAECKIASHLWSTCKVIAGSEEALQFLQENMKDFEIKRLKRLNVSGAFHTNHMKPAAVALKEVLKDMTITSPKIPVHSNIDGKPYSRPDQIRTNLPKQLYSSVQWEQTMHILYDRSADVPFPNTYECGPGLSLKAILKQVNVKAISGMQNIEA